MKREENHRDKEPVPVLAETPLPQPKCPYCRAGLDEIGWLKNDQAGLVTFFHNVPACMKVINIQAIPVQQQQPRIVPAGALPRQS